MDLVGTPGTSEGVLVSHDRGLVGSELPTSSIQARWVIQACESLKLTITTMGTAVCYLRKYKDYHRSSLSPEKAPYCLPAIVYLACKTNEELRTIRDIFNACFVVRHRDYDVAEMDSMYASIKGKIILCEHELIRILNFNFEVDLPYPYLLNFARLLRVKQDPVHVAFMLLNDALAVDDWMLYPAHHLAIAALYCGLQLTKSKMDTPASIASLNTPTEYEYASKYDKEAMASLDAEWWRRFDIEEAALIRLGKWFLSIYES